MKERNWKYKITGNWFGPMVIAITTAVSGGFTFWLYTAHDGAFVGLGGLTAFFCYHLRSVRIRCNVFQVACG